ncbi:ABC-type sn-glycerol-3-phosphate transporter, permease subunit [Corynebacterium glutamicum MB001]|uniref:ABC-type transporter, permease components n=1 Tax=Corynebacterium glutamicum (strain ATCC 13032 / DSM 20300 / JCM 1318 / BCRC 11384 / CCUG 27702 / LMG 3730 / NBRC 12168 / NCIMB 10025 / NRRL B-2784 / 534) TaxID=196627 RepID=Q8NQP2_CORGL|nr:MULTISPECIES: carbohydrate ABC transporter permease [Corynebacterium]AGT05352.1 ABC-type sn-glycerol-3-phosphate transporter, permease subunit [Corynebacterium glutamicum MB001]ALP50087.1 glycerol-3-phosphate ABC transporter permease [Corynebacterium glutamicum]ANR62479.1 sn-glycerol-3-phosphate transport system permease [[Brevibacterium] flavum ZL-1]ANR65480.1 sn-glycerol-3-phosphate transport system permease [Corynebacterium glutamicum ZL-6]ANU33604.1 glycerol-3-phosphate ABC transporter 
MISTDRNVLVKIMGYVGMVLAILFIGLPLVFIVLTSFKQQSEIYTQPVTWFPSEFNFDNYANVFERVPFLNYFRNSIIITVILCLVKIILGVISAYALSILRFPGRNLVFLLVISALMVPSEVTVISNYALVSQLGWRDTYQGIIVPLAGIAFGTFLMRNHFMSIPSELIEAARMDHCGHFRLLWKVLLPISMPTLVAFSMITVVNEWNQYLWPFLMAETDNSATLPIGLTMLQNNEGVSNWGPVMAATIMTMLPVLVMFLALQQYMIKGLISGAVKG